MKVDYVAAIYIEILKIVSTKIDRIFNWNEDPPYY